MKEFKNIIFVLWLFMSHKKVITANFEDFFENFECEGEICYIYDISSTENLEEICSNLRINTFEYYKNTDSCHYYGSAYCETIRYKFQSYERVVFRNSKFKKFPSAEFSSFNHIKSLSAVNVGLTEINRSLVFLHLVSLEKLILQNNQIENIDVLAFHDSNENLTSINLSYNKLREIHDSIFNAIGNSKEAELLLNFNGIERIISTGSISKKSNQKFKFIDLTNNKLKNFIFNCTNIDTLDLSENQLEEFEIRNCSVNSLNLNNNNIRYLHFENLSTLRISNNKILQNLTLNVDKLRILEMKNLPAKIMSYEILKKAKKLENLDLAGTFFGQAKIETFSEMILLKNLNLSKTGMSHIEYGMFSHQSEVENFDISYNNLGFLDINMLSSMKNLQKLSISGNNLTKLESIDFIEKFFPSLVEVRIDENQWNCSYLANLMKVLNDKSINIAKPNIVVKNSPNVLGIKCITTAQVKIQPININDVNQTISIKLNEIIEQINDERTNRNNHKFDLDVIKSEIFNIQKEILEMKTKILSNQMTAIGSNNRKESNSSVDMKTIKHMIEELNNFTLEKQKLANDQILVKISELQNQILKSSIEQNNFLHKKEMPEILSKIESKNYQSLENHSQSNNSTSATEILLTIMLTSFLLIGIIYLYSKIKQTLYRTSNLMSVRARSTNTLNTTVEIPFGDRN
ncbi:hypothetical protein PVAND_000165 [Polypedilum vanderplanki]|uniref:Uncharacterized protein n=1 Tax=Polypedilum vanderplanki TaxID=319348 RepID=A0A9J6BJH8_POLVA|nr:hypothetical protein PVAND_000165 [Polypedilum vanderplanki]